MSDDGAATQPSALASHIEGDEPATLVNNSAWGFASQILGMVAGGAVSIIAIRGLSGTAWGQYAVATALVSVFIVFSELGLSTLTLRELSTHPAKASATLGTALLAVAIAATFSATLIVPIAVALGFDYASRLMVAIAVPTLFFQPLLGIIRAAFNARRRLAYVARFDAVQTAVYTLTALALLLLGLGAPSLVIGLVAGNVAAAILGASLVRRRLRIRPQFRGQLATTMPFMRLALPIALVGGIAILYDRVDVLLLSLLGNTLDVARYSVPYTVVRLTWSVPSVIGAAFFPLYARLREDDPTEGSRAFFLIVRVFVFLSGATALALSFAGEELLTFAFGARYATSATALTILAWGLVASFQNYVLWYGILAARRERAVVPVQLVGLAVNVSANFLLIPRLGPEGAAIAFLLSDLVTTGGQFVIVHRHLYRVPVRLLVLRPLAAASVAVLIGLAASQLSGVAAAAAGVLTYVGFLLSSRYVTAEEWRPLTDPIAAMARRVRG